MKASGEYVLIAANPKSGASSSRERVAELREALLSRGFQCEIRDSLTQVRDECRVLHAKSSLRAIVSAGGDGTADALANLIPSDVPLLIFPLGTENLLAKHLGITSDLKQACGSIDADRRIQLDVGSANGKLFLVMLRCGFDAEVVRNMHASRKGHINRWSYAGPIISSLRKYRFPELFVDFDAAPAHVAGSADIPSQKVAWLFVFNVPRYAAALDFCPQANPCDGQLDVCTFSRPGIFSGLGYLARLWMGSHQKMPDFQHRLASRLEITVSANPSRQVQDVPFQIDGDPGGVLPLEIKVLPGRLTLLVPPEYP
jgi:diacylglycerol kinase (ATP)